MAVLLSGTTIGGHVAVHANNISTYALTSIPSNVITTSGGQTIGGITYFSNGESLNLYGIRGRFTNEYIHLYEKVGIGHPGGWGQGEANTPTQGLSIYGGINIAYARDNGATINTYTRINKNWGGGDYSAEAFTIRGTYPSITLRSTQHNSKWLIHHASALQFYYGGTVDDNNWANKFEIPTDGNIWMAWANANISTLLDAKQNASTAITTSNIGSQSVSYASSAGNADTTSQIVFNDLKTNFPSGAGGGHSFAANHYSMGLDSGNGGWDSPHYRDLIIGYHTGVRIGAAYSGIRFYNNSPTTDANNDGNGDGGETLLMTIGGYVGTANQTDVVVNNNLFANASMRAPIFYDSNDTNYYLDPSNTGVALRISGAIRGDHTSWTGEHNKIQWHSSHMYFQNMNDGFWLFRKSDGAEPFQFHASGYVNIIGGSNTPINITGSAHKYLTINPGNGYEAMVRYIGGSGSSWYVGKRTSGQLVGTESFHFYSEAAGATVGGINPSGDMHASGSMRAPIFYDSNNTDYYLDPNGTSVLSSAHFGGGILDNASARILMPGGAYSVNSPSGTTGAIRINLPTATYGVNTMMSMTVHVYEYSTGQSFTLKVGGYNYFTHSWYNVFAYLLNDSGKGSDVPVYFGNDGTRDVIWIGEPSWSWSYPNVFVTDFQAGHSQNSNWKTGWSISFDTSARTNVSASRIAHRQIDTGTISSQSVSYADESGYSASSGSVEWTSVQNKPATFPPSSHNHDDRYYTESESDGRYLRSDVYNSNYGGLQVFRNIGSIDGSWPDSDHTLSLENSDAGTIVVNFHRAGYTSNNLWYNGSQFRFDQVVTSTADFRAPIFYDSNDINYYVDPNGASKLNGLHIVSSGNQVSGYDASLYIGGTNNDWGIIVGKGSYDYGINVEVSGSATYAYSSPNFRVSGAGAVYSTILYDSNDASYYLDPNSTSRLWRVNSYYLSNPSAVSDNHSYGMYFDSGLSTAYAIFREGGDWAWPYPDLRIAFHTGIKIGANAGYEGIRFYTDYDMSTQVMSVNNGSDPLGGGNVYVNNSLQAGSSLRAPIFYDSADTTYYLDPAGNGTRAAFLNGNVWISPKPESYGEGIAFLMPSQATWGGIRWLRGVSNFTGAWALGYFGNESNDNIGFHSAGVNGWRLDHSWNMTVIGSVISPTILVNNHSDNTRGYRIHNTSGTAVSAMFVNSSNQLVIAAGAVDQVNLNKKVLVNGVALGVNVAPSATAGRIDASNDIVAYSSSDERLKENITPIENALDKVKSLTGVEFDWKPEYKHAHGYEGHDTGIIAQQVEAVMPSAVRTNDTGFLAVRYEKLIGLLIEANKELAARVEELEKKLS